MHVLLAQASWEELDVAPAAVDVLLVLHRELHHQRLVAVAEGLEARREGVETGVLARLDPCQGNKTPPPSGSAPSSTAAPQLGL